MWFAVSLHLDQGLVAAEEAFFVGVEDGNERHLRKVETLPQQVDSYQHVVLALSQGADDSKTLHRFDLGKGFKFQA